MNENSTSENTEENNQNMKDEDPGNSNINLPESQNSESDNSAVENVNDTNPETEIPPTENESGEEEPVSRFQEYFNETVEGYKPKMTDALLTFFALREIDEELTDIEDEKGDLPQKIETIKSKIESADKQLSDKKSQLAKLSEEKSKTIEEDNSYEERISKYDEQKYDVRSNKEYDEIVKTIESLFEEVKKNEIRLREVSILVTVLEAEIETLEASHKELSSELAENQTLLDELNEQYKQDESTLKEKRRILFEKLDTSSGALYERINNSYKGEATAIVRKGNCSGCYNSIPPQRVIEIKSAEKIFTCQSCGRILISDETIPPAN